MICSRILCQEPRHDGSLCRWNRAVHWVKVLGTCRHTILTCFYDKVHLLSSLSRFKVSPSKMLLVLWGHVPVATARYILSPPLAFTIHLHCLMVAFSAQLVFLSHQQGDILFLLNRILVVNRTLMKQDSVGHFSSSPVVLVCYSPTLFIFYLYKV